LFDLRIRADDLTTGSDLTRRSDLSIRCPSGQHLVSIRSVQMWHSDSLHSSYLLLLVLLSASFTLVPALLLVLTLQHGDLWCCCSYCIVTLFFHKESPELWLCTPLLNSSLLFSVVLILFSVFFQYSSSKFNL
jgi:hypothetical protein